MHQTYTNKVQICGSHVFKNVVFFAIILTCMNNYMYTPQNKLGTTKCKGYNFNNFIANNKTNVGIK